MCHFYDSVIYAQNIDTDTKTTTLCYYILVFPDKEHFCILAISLANPDHTTNSCLFFLLSPHSLFLSLSLSLSLSLFELTIRDKKKKINVYWSVPQREGSNIKNRMVKSICNGRNISQTLFSPWLNISLHASFGNMQKKKKKKICDSHKEFPGLDLWAGTIFAVLQGFYKKHFFKNSGAKSFDSLENQ